MSNILEMVKEIGDGDEIKTGGGGGGVAQLYQDARKAVVFVGYS